MAFSSKFVTDIQAKFSVNKGVGNIDYYFM